MTQTPHKRTFGTKLSSNTPLPPRYTPKQHTPKSIAREFVDSSVSTAVDRVRGNDGRTTPDVRSGDTREVKWTPVSKLAFSSPDFKIYRGTPTSSSSSSSSPANDSLQSDADEEKHWSQRAVTAAHRPDGSFLYSTLHATSPSQSKSWARVAAESSLNSVPTASSAAAYPTQQLRRSPQPNSPNEIFSPPFPSPDSTASVAPTPFYSRHMPKEREIASPTGSIISTTSSVARREAALSNTVELGPAEYGIVFPPGALPFELEGVICTGDTPIGGCISQINSKFDASNCRYLSSTVGKPSLQKNDLLISINSISLQSRPYPAILSLLKQYEPYEKTLVFRSLDKVWKSTFQPKTMRHLRSGKRVATALDVESMDRELWSWVETPTKVEPLKSKKRGGKNKKEMVIVEEESTSTPVKQGQFNSAFSPSNVKKLSRATPSPLKGVNSKAHEASTAKKKNLRRSKSYAAAAATPGKKRLQRICRVLVGEDIGSNGDLERVAILKKEVLKELESVRVALMKEREEEMHRMVTLDANSNPSVLEKEKERVQKESNPVAEMQQKLYQAYEAMQRSEKEHASKLSQKEEECTTLQSKYEAELAKLRAELRLASEKSLEKEQKSIIVQTDLEEERSKTQAIQSILDETQRSKVQQEKLISSLEEEADRKQKLIEESEAASDLKTEELHRLRKKIAELESKYKAHSKKMQRTSSDSAQKSSEREGILLQMVEQQRIDFEKREKLLEEQVQGAESQLEKEKAAHAKAISALKAQLSSVETQRDDAVQQLDEAKSSLSDKSAAFDALQAKTSQCIADLEAERNGALEKLEETKSHHSEREEALIRKNEEFKVQISTLSEKVEHQSSTKVEQDELVQQLQKEVQSQSAVNADQHSLIQELKADVHSLTESVQEQSVVKAILAENLSKHIAASGDGLVKLDELSSAVESKLHEFSIRIANSESGCRAATVSFRQNEAEFRSQLESLSSDVAQKESSLQRSQSDTAELESKVLEVAAELKNSLAREQNMALRLEAERAELVRKEADLEEALATCEQLKAKNDEYSAMIETVKTESSQRISELEVERESAVRDLNVKINAHDDQTLCIQDQLDAKHAEVKQLINQIQTLELEASESSVFSKEREANLRQSHVELSNLNAEKLQLQAQLEAEHKERSSSECLLRGEIHRLKADLADMFDRNKELQSEIDLINSDLNENKRLLSANREEFIVTLEQKDVTIAQKQTAMQSMSDELSLLHDEIISTNAELKCSKQYANELESSKTIQLASLRHDNAKLHDSYSNLQQKHSSLEMKCADMSAKLKSALSSLEDKELRVSVLVSELDEMDAKVTDLLFNIQTVKKEKDILKASFSEREDQLTSESALLREQVLEKDRRITDLESKMTRLVSEMSSVDSELNAATDKLQVMSSQHENEIKATQFEAEMRVAQLKSNLETAEDLLDKGDTHIQSLVEDCERLENEISELKTELACAIAEKDNLKARLEGDIEVLNGKNEGLMRELQFCKDDACKLEAEKHQFSDAVSLMKLSLADADSSHGELCSTLSDLRQEMAQMKVQNESLSGTIEDLSIQLNQSKRDIKTLEAIKSEHLEEISLLESTKDMLLSQINHFECKSAMDSDVYKADKQELSENLKSKTAQITALTTQKADLMSAVEKLQVRVTTLTTAKKELEVKVDDCASQLQRMRCESQNLLKVDQDADCSLQSKQEEVTKLKAVLEELKQKYEANEDSLRCQLLQSLDAREQDAADATKIQLELENRLDEQSDIIIAKDKDLLSIKSQVVELDQIIDDLRSRLKELEVREISLQESVKGKEEAVSDLCSKRDELKLVMENLIEQHRAEKERIMQSLNDQKVHKAELTSQNAELEVTVANLQGELESLRETNDAQSNRIEELRKALKAAQLKIDEELEKFESNQADIAKSVNEKDDIISDLSASKDSLEKTVDKLKAEMKQLEDEFSTNKESFESELLKRDTVERGLKSSVKELEQRVFHLDSEAHLKKEAYESERMHALRDTTNLHNSVAAEKIKYQHLKENLEATRATLNLKESELRAIMADKEALELETKQKEAKFQSTIKNLEHDIEDKKAASFELSSRINLLTSSLDLKEKEIETLKATCKSSQSSLESKLIESQQEMFRYQQSSFETESRLTAKIETLMNNVDAAKRKEKDLTEQLMSVRVDLGNVVESKRIIEQERDVLISDYSNTSNQLSNVQDKLRSCQDELQIETSSRQQDQKSKDELRLKLQEAMSWSDSLRTEIKQKKKCLDENENELRDALDSNESLRAEIEKKNILLSEKEQEILELSTQIQSIKLTYEATVTEHQSSIELLKSNSQHELTALRSELAQETNAHQVDLTKMDELRLKLKEAIDWSDSLKTSLKDNQALLQEKEGQVVFLSSQIELVQTTSQKTVTQLNDKYLSSIKSHKDELSSVRNDLKSCHEELVSSKTSYQEGLSKMKDFSKKMEANKNTELAEKEKEIKSLQHELEEVKCSSQKAIELARNEFIVDVGAKDDNINKLEIHLVNASEQISSLKLEIVRKETALAEKQDEIASLLRELESVKFSSQQALERSRYDFIAALEAKDSEIIKLNKRETELSSALEATDLQLEKVKEEMELHRVRFNESIREKEVNISTLSDHKVSLELTVDQMKIKISELEEATCQDKTLLESKLLAMQLMEEELKSITEKLLSCQEELEQEKNAYLESSSKNKLLDSKLQDALDQNEQMCSDVEERDGKISSLCAMLHRTHLDICQLSMELSCTKGASVLCIASFKKDLESAMNDLVQYYEAKEQNYRSIINELNRIVSEHHNEEIPFNEDFVSTPMDKEISLCRSQSHKCSDQSEHMCTTLDHQRDTIERLTNELAIVNDELTSLQAEVKCSKEVEASYHSEQILLHRTISNILNSPSSSIDIDEAIESSMHPYERFLNFVEIELRDLSILYNVDMTGIEIIASKPELINAMLQTMKMSAVSMTSQKVDLDSTSDSQQIRDFLSDIDLAQNKVIDMNKQMQYTSRSRDEFEKLLAMEQKRTVALENAISNASMELESKSKMLTQTEEQYRKLHVKHENATAEIDQCQKLALELKRIIIEKNSEIQTKQNQLFELQFKLDDITARSDGLKASFEGVESTQADLILVDKSTTRHDELAEEVARLESKILQRDQDAAQLSSMHEAIVDGLEDQCQQLVDEIDEARDYISALEDAQSRLMEDVEQHRIGCQAKDRINKDLESALHILKEQKIQAEEDNRLIASEVSKLAVAVASCASFVEGFSFDVQSPTSCCGNLQYIGSFIQYLYATRESAASSDTITPKTRGRGGFSERSDIIVGLNEMKDTLKNVLSSPRLTPVKQTDNRTDQDDLYYDLVNAVEQLERLSQNFRNCQEQWREKESHLTSRINHLESSSHIQIANLEIEQAWRRRLTATVIENLQRRRHCSVLRRAFQTWAFQIRWRKHLDIVKDMAKELLQTRQKVLLLKSQFIGTSI